MNAIIHNLCLVLLILLSIRFYYRSVHPTFIDPRSFGSILYALLGSLGVTFLAILILNAVVWVGLWGNNFDILFTERNLLVYLFSMCFALLISLGYGLKYLGRPSR